MPFWSDLLRSAAGGRHVPPAPSARPAPSAPFPAPFPARDEAVATAAPARETPAYHPASDAGALDEVGRWRARAFDLLSDGVLLFGAGGELAYRNAAAAAMTDDAGLPLLREARALAMSALARAGDRRVAAGDAARELTVGAVHYHLTALPTPPALPAGSLAPAACVPAVLVAVTRTSTPLPSPAALRHRFQLTAREASVALLLAEGRSNAGVARRLGISENTVRHYIETVLLKLGVPSRAAVAAVLLGVYEHAGALDDEPAPPPQRPSRGRRGADAG